MAELIRCDECRRETTEAEAVDWLKTDNFGNVTFGAFHGRAHFCGVECLKTWAERRIARAKRLGLPHPGDYRGGVQ